MAFVSQKKHVLAQNSQENRKHTATAHLDCFDGTATLPMRSMDSNRRIRSSVPSHHRPVSLHLESTVLCESPHVSIGKLAISHPV